MKEGMQDEKAFVTVGIGLELALVISAGRNRQVSFEKSQVCYCRDFSNRNASH
jgi:hypothetical protein